MKEKRQLWKTAIAVLLGSALLLQLTACDRWFAPEVTVTAGDKAVQVLESSLDTVASPDWARDGIIFDQGTEQADTVTVDDIHNLQAVFSVSPDSVSVYQIYLKYGIQPDEPLIVPTCIEWNPEYCELDVEFISDTKANIVFKTPMEMTLESSIGGSRYFGYRMICTWGNDSKAYDFILRFKQNYTTPQLETLDDYESAHYYFEQVSKDTINLWEDLEAFAEQFQTRSAVPRQVYPDYPFVIDCIDDTPEKITVYYYPLQNNMLDMGTYEKTELDIKETRGVYLHNTKYDDQYGCIYIVCELEGGVYYHCMFMVQS